jgi:histone-lysine N-methyltransferase SETMAR
LTANDEFHKKKFDELIKDNRQIIQREIFVKLGISQECMGHIINVLQYQKVCARWVPYMLTVEMKASRVEICQQLLSHYEKEGEEFLHNIMTADETWVHHYEPEIKRQSMEHHQKVSHVKKNSKPRLQQGNSWLQLFGIQMVLLMWTSVNLGPPSTQSTTLEHFNISNNG